MLISHSDCQTSLLSSDSVVLVCLGDTWSYTKHIIMVYQIWLDWWIKKDDFCDAYDRGSREWQMLYNLNQPWATCYSLPDGSLFDYEMWPFCLKKFPKIFPIYFKLLDASELGNT